MNCQRSYNHCGEPKFTGLKGAFWIVAKDLAGSGSLNASMIFVAICNLFSLVHGMGAGYGAPPGTVTVRGVAPTSIEPARATHVRVRSILMSKKVGRCDRIMALEVNEASVQKQSYTSHGELAL